MKSIITIAVLVFSLTGLSATNITFATDSVAAENDFVLKDLAKEALLANPELSSGFKSKLLTAHRYTGNTKFDTRVVKFFVTRMLMYVSENGDSFSEDDEVAKVEFKELLYRLEDLNLKFHQKAERLIEANCTKSSSQFCVTDEEWEEVKKSLVKAMPRDVFKDIAVKFLLED